MLQIVLSIRIMYDYCTCCCAGHVLGTVGVCVCVCVRARERESEVQFNIKAHHDVVPLFLQGI